MNQESRSKILYSERLGKHRWVLDEKGRKIALEREHEMYTNLKIFLPNLARFSFEIGLKEEASRLIDETMKEIRENGRVPEYETLRIYFKKAEEAYEHVARGALMLEIMASPEEPWPEAEEVIEEQEGKKDG